MKELSSKGVSFVNSSFKCGPKDESWRAEETFAFNYTFSFLLLLVRHLLLEVMHLFLVAYCFY